jgi:hypothetical protein
MKILKPVSVSRRLPKIPEGEPFSAAVIVRYQNKKVSDSFTALSLAYCDGDGEWIDANEGLKIIGIIFKPGGPNEVIKWYEEIEIESLFPDDDQSTTAADAHSKNFTKQLSHIEGQSFLENHIIKMLKK